MVKIWIKAAPIGAMPSKMGHFGLVVDMLHHFFLLLHPTSSLSKFIFHMCIFGFGSLHYVVGAL